MWNNNVSQKYSVDQIQHRIYVHNTHSLRHMRVRGGGDNAQLKTSSNAHVRFEDINNSNLQPHAFMDYTVYVFKDTRPYRNVTNWQNKQMIVECLLILTSDTFSGYGLRSYNTHKLPEVNPPPTPQTQYEIKLLCVDILICNFTMFPCIEITWPTIKYNKNKTNDNLQLNKTACNCYDGTIFIFIIHPAPPSNSVCVTSAVKRSKMIV